MVELLLTDFVINIIIIAVSFVVLNWASNLAIKNALKVSNVTQLGKTAVGFSLIAFSTSLARIDSCLYSCFIWWCGTLSWERFRFKHCEYFRNNRVSGNSSLHKITSKTQWTKWFKRSMRYSSFRQIGTKQYSFWSLHFLSNSNDSNLY